MSLALLSLSSLFSVGYIFLCEGRLVLAELAKVLFPRYVQKKTKKVCGLGGISVWFCSYLPGFQHLFSPFSTLSLFAERLGLNCSISLSKIDVF